MTFASAQLYVRDIETILDMPICGNRSDVQNWNVSYLSKEKLVCSQSVLSFFLLGICLFSFCFPVSCSIDCDDCVVCHYHCDHMAKRFGSSNKRSKKSRTSGKIEASPAFFIETFGYQRYLSPKWCYQDWHDLLLQDDRFIESSIRNAGSLGVIPRAKIKTVKMTLVIVIGECVALSSLGDGSDSYGQ